VSRLDQTLRRRAPVGLNDDPSTTHFGGPEQPVAEAHQSADTSARRERSSPAFVAVVFVLALTPVIAVLVTRVGRPYFPMQDIASIDLLVRDVFTAHTPLVGAYSRGFNHPGPMMFWLLAPLSAITGGATWATLVGGALFQGAAIAATGWLALRRGGVAFMLMILAALGLAYSSFATEAQFLEAWNPYLAFSLFLLFLLQSWALAEGSRWQLVGIAVTGSLLVQFHIGYLPLVAAATLWACITVAFDRNREATTERTSPERRTVGIVTVVALVALWAAPVVQQFTGDPGNLGEIWRYFTDGAPVAGLGAAARVFAVEFRVLPPWLFGSESFGFGTGTVEQASAAWLLVPVVLLVAGYLAARRSRRRGDRRLVELAAVNAVASLLALSRVSVDLLPFLFFWRVISAVFVVVASGWAIAHALRVRQRSVPVSVAAVALVVVIALTFGARALDVVNHTQNAEPLERYGREAMAQVHERPLPRSPILVRALGPTLGGFDQGIIDALDRDGARVRVDEQYGFHFGDQRTATPAEVGEIWYVAQDGHYAAMVGDLPGARRVAYVTPLPKAEDDELVELQRSLAAQFRAAGRPDLIDALDGIYLGAYLQTHPLPGVDRRAAERADRLNAKVYRSNGCRCSITAFSADDAPNLPSSLG
jgi:hypothetical protein